MKVFVTGATGAVGEPAVRALVADGHDVTAVARTPAKAERIRSLGATPVTVDLFDPAAVNDAVRGHDAVVNLATHIPPVTQMVRTGAWSENDRIRREVSRNLVDAALASDVQVFVQESIAFMLADGGDQWLDETAAVDIAPYASSTLEAEAQAQRFAAAGRTGIVLRFGLFHSPTSDQTTMQLQLARRDGIGMVLGPADAYLAIIHTDDAGTAAAAALRAPSGTYYVVVDEPLTRRDYLQALAAAVGRKTLHRAPNAAGKLGGSKTDMLMRSHRISNARFKQATGWSPRYRSAREAFVALARALPAADHVSLAARVLLALSAVGSLVVGLWAQFAPRSFYDSFPGSGRHWVSADGPFNEHLVRDVGGLNLALALVAIVAVVTGARSLARVAAGATLVFAVPHLAYHLAHLDLYATGDQVGNAVTLGLGVVLPALVLVLSAGPRPQPTSGVAAAGRLEPFPS